MTALAVVTKHFTLIINFCFLGKFYPGSVGAVLENGKYRIEYVRPNGEIDCGSKLGFILVRDLIL